MNCLQNPAAPRRGFFVFQLLVCGGVLFVFLVTSAFAGDTISYRDPAGRFSFDYPQAWGEVVPGTNDGFGDRVAARRFTRFSNGQLGGEAVLMRGRVMLDIQLLGGLYDAISLEMLPPPMLMQVLKVLPAPDASNFCRLLAKEAHLDTNLGFFKPLGPPMKQALSQLDRTRNIDPKVHRCDRKGDTITFHKEATYQAGAMPVRQHLYGAIRFLKGRYSAFQLVQGGLAAPDAALLNSMTGVVTSFKTQ